MVSSDVEVCAKEKRKERLLLSSFCFLVLQVVGGGAASTALSKRMSLRMVQMASNRLHGRDGVLCLPTSLGDQAGVYVVVFVILSVLWRKQWWLSHSFYFRLC